MLKYFLIGIVLAIHIFVVAIFWFGDTLSLAPGDDTSMAEEEQAVPEMRADGSAPAVPDSLAAMGASARNISATTLPNYSEQYFGRKNLSLPAAILKKASNCQAAAVFVVESHTMLWGKNVETAYPIASLTKMMTTLLLMDEIHQGQRGITLETPVRVTKNATRIGTRQVWLDPRETFTIDELLKSILIRSANDCAYLLGEFLAEGSHDEFVKRMNARGKQLGCRKFMFYNAHGLPFGKKDLENQGCILELAYLAERLWQYPEVMKWTATRQEFIRENTKKPFQLDTTNRLLRSCPGVNGMKTGMTDQAGYCLVATCERQQGRVIAIVMGVKGRGGDKIRDEIARQLIEWAYSSQFGAIQ